jgi:phosphatidylserine decarboxylase
VLSDYIKIWLLYCLPQHAISRCIFFLTRLQTDLKNPFIRWFIRTFKVDMSEAVESNINNYPTFNAFFTRAIKPELRPIAQAPDVLACPVDGAVSQLGTMRQGNILQAKNRHYTLLELLGGRQDWAQRFAQGSFITLYLSPRDYHRIHMPYAGVLREMLHIPGRLFSVASHTTRVLPRLFARNERVIAFFDSPIGSIAMVLVGAINVAAIETVWHGLVTPPQRKKISAYDYSTQKISLAKGEEMGRFNMGSTVILLTESPFAWDPTLRADSPVKLGQILARKA